MKNQYGFVGVKKLWNMITLQINFTTMKSFIHFLSYFSCIFLWSMNCQYDIRLDLLLDWVSKPYVDFYYLMFISHTLFSMLNFNYLVKVLVFYLLYGFIWYLFFDFIDLYSTLKYFMINCKCSKKAIFYDVSSLMANTDLYCYYCNFLFIYLLTFEIQPIK